MRKRLSSRIRKSGVIKGGCGKAGLAKRMDSAPEGATRPPNGRARSGPLSPRASGERDGERGCTSGQPAFTDWRADFQSPHLSPIAGRRGSWKPRAGGARTPVLLPLASQIRHAASRRTEAFLTHF
jgi:hypothetical protein